VDLRAENFIAFFTVCGFFVGLVFVTIKLNDPIEIMVYTFLITFFFYLLIHIVIMNYVDVKRLLKQSFDKQMHEDRADYLISELALREKRMEGILTKLAAENILMQQSLGKKHERAKAKAA